MDAEATLQYVHAATGMVFGKKVGKFVRTGVRELNNNPENVKVDYEMKGIAGKKAVITVYVYPGGVENASSVLQDEYDMMKSYLLDIYPDHNDLAEGMTTIGQASGPQDGMMLSFTHRSDSLFKGKECISAGYLFAYGPWLIKYRSVYPVKDMELGAREVGVFLQALKWPKL